VVKSCVGSSIASGQILWRAEWMPERYNHRIACTSGGE
jgi:hypothetical protein